MNVCWLSRFESKCFNTKGSLNRCVALLALTETYAFALKALKKDNGKFRMKKVKVWVANKPLLTYC